MKLSKAFFFSLIVALSVAFENVNAEQRTLPNTTNGDVTNQTSESGGQIGDYLYYIDQGTKYIYQYVGNDSIIEIPEGYELGEKAFQGMKQLVSVGLPEGLTAISDYCFDGCTNLTSFTLPSTVTSIGQHAFSQSGVVSITIPQTVKRLGNHAFYFCENVESLTIAEGSIDRIEDFTFSYNNKVTEISLPQTINYIGRGAFYECASLERINIPDGVKRLGSFAFKNCDKLSEMVIPSSIDSIEMHTFFDCNLLTKVTLPEGLKRIGESAFQQCWKLTEIDIPSTVTYIGQLAFGYCSRLTRAEIPTGIDHLGPGVFYECYTLKSVSLPMGLKTIPRKMFFNCSLNNIELPESIEKIEDGAFEKCAINTINWPNSLQSVGYMAFAGGRNLPTPVIPHAMEYGKLILSDNSHLERIYCYADVVLPDSVFHIDQIYNSTLYVKPSMLEAYRNSAWGSRFRQIMPLGDVCLDNKYDVADITAAINSFNGTELPPYSNLRFTHADLNGDGSIDAQDIAIVERLVTNDEQVTPFVPLPPETPKEVEIPQPRAGCQLLYDICTYETEMPMILDYLNQERFEACIEGMRDPNNSSTVLTEADFVPFRWSTDLERVARIRSAEAAQTIRSHSRLNGLGIGSVVSNGVSLSAENLGWGYSGIAIRAMVAQCEEKTYSLHKAGGNSGHYLNFINPKYRYIGIAGTGIHGASAFEMSGRDLSSKESFFLPPSGIDTVRLEVKSSYIVGYSIGSSESVTTGTYRQLMVYANTQTTTSSGKLILPYQGNFTVSDPELATIDEKGRIWFLKPGTVTVTGYLDGTTIGTKQYTISCKHDYYYEPLPKNKHKGICAKCGNEITVN